MLKNNGFHNRHSPILRAFSPLSLFSGGTPGAWYDPSDLTTLFQDSAGTTPVTAVEQPVGRMLDKSGNGNHAFQATSASRPVLSVRYNLLTKTEQFDDAAWAKSALTITANATTAPDGTTTADLAIPTTANAEHYFDIAATPIVSGVEYKISVAAKIGGYRWMRLAFNSSVTPASNRAAWFDLQNGVLGTVQSGVTATIVPDNNGFYRCSISRAATSSATPAQSGFIQVTNADNVASAFAGDGTSGIFVWGADLRVANNGITQPAYQRVNTPTDYNTTGFLPYLRFDGVDDSLSTNSFSISNPITTFDGVRFNSAAAGYVTDSVSGTRLYNLTDGTSRQAGITSTLSSGSITIANTTNVETVIYNGASSSYRRNGAVVSTGNTGSGTISTGLVIGRSQFSSAYLNGQIYSMIIVGKAVTAGELSSTETYVNQKTGAY